MKTRRLLQSIVILTLTGFCPHLFAGSLEPSASPGPTMKTLDEVEPRIPISQTDIPKTISSSGSYYLTEDISISVAMIVITVDANDVTIDLAGFVLSGPDPGVNSYGIYMDGRSNVEIRNGTVRDLRYGILEASGQDHRVIDVRVLSNDRYGIYLDGSGHLVKDCTASNNGDSSSTDVYGIYTGSGSTVTGSTARNNGNSATGDNIFGIKVGSDSTVTGSTANDNGNSATSTGNGIEAGAGSTVTGNTAYNNQYYGIYTSDGCTVTGNTAYNNQGFSGISAGSGSTVTGNTSYSNQGHGIRAYGGSTVTGNTVYGNQSTGIFASAGCMVTGNTAYNNQDFGISAYDGSTVTGNTARNNQYSGISTSYRCTVTGNTAVDNNQSNTAGMAGIAVDSDCIVKGNTLNGNLQNNIYVFGSDNAIEENLVTDCTQGNGIYFNVAGNFYANNRASGNSTDYAGTLPVAGGDGGGNASF